MKVYIPNINFMHSENPIFKRHLIAFFPDVSPASYNLMTCYFDVLILLGRRTATSSHVFLSLIKECV